MNRCEDYPCCGHGPTSTGGDGGGCPDEQGRFDCVLCGQKMPKGATRSVCHDCIENREMLDPFERACQDADWERSAMLEDY